VNSTLPKNAPVETGLTAMRSVGILPRLLLLSSLFVLELIAISAYIRRGLGGMKTSEWIVAFAALFLTFGYSRAHSSFRSLISSQLERTPVSWRYLGGHLCAILALICLSILSPAHGTPQLEHFFVTGALWGLGLLGMLLAVFAFFPPRFCVHLIRSTGSASVYAAAGATLAVALLQLRNAAWVPLSRLTFASVELLLRPVVSSVVADAKTATIGTQRFQVTLTRGCSGIEGIGLMLVFSILWLWFFRKESRFPQAFLLVPTGLLLAWLMNTVRIAVLILIGNAGSRDVATHGFHSEAGWVAFNLLALGFAISAQRWSWVAVRNADQPLEDRPVENLTAAYLMPFLAILAAAMISRAASGGFEWLYPLRFFAAAAALWFFRSKYTSLDWHFGWLAPIAGAAVFVMWLGLESLSGAHTGNGIAAGLAPWPPFARIAWLTLRVLGAVVTVPIAEELAFRCYLIRRLISSHFESVDPRTWTYFSVLASSVAFGLMHGDRWLAGIAAGILYAAVFLFRGRIGDAVVAHATTNALLAIWVLTRGAWYMW
jgi:exosortase E/protease (VPEID-CTERM system)